MVDLWQMKTYFMKITIFPLCVMMILLSSTFNAQCNAVNVPYTENFNTTAPGAIPVCTTTQVISGSAWRVSANGGLLMYYNENGNSWFYTQGVNLEVGKVYNFKFDYSSDISPQSFAVAYGTSPVNTSMTNVIHDFPNPPVNNAFTSESFTVSPSVTGVYYFGFNYKGGDFGGLMIDNVSVALQATLSATEARYLKDGVEVYPNPAKDDLFVKNFKKNTEVEILDISGKLALSLSGVKEKIDVSQLMRGTYFLVIKNEDGTLSKTKFIKR